MRAIIVEHHNGQAPRVGELDRWLVEIEARLCRRCSVCCGKRDKCSAVNAAGRQAWHAKWRGTGKQVLEFKFLEGHIRMPEIQVKTIIFAKGFMGLLCDQKQW